MEERLLGVADYNRIGNDLFWRYHHFINYCDDKSKKVYEWFRCDWDGYADNYWYEHKVLTKDFTGDLGNERKFRLDLETHQVYEIIPEFRGLTIEELKDYLRFYYGYEKIDFRLSKFKTIRGKYFK